MDYTPHMVQLAEDYVRASNDQDEQLFFHIHQGNIRQDGTRIDGPNYDLLNHYSVKTNHYYTELARLIPNGDARDHLILSTHSRLDP